MFYFLHFSTFARVNDRINYAAATASAEEEEEEEKEKEKEKEKEDNLQKQE